MSQSTLIAGAILAGFILYVSARNTLPQYLAYLGL